MRFIQEFKKFALRGNVIGLSVGMIMGSAFGKIVTAVIEDLFMPMVNPLLVTDRNWQSIEVGPGIKIGHFIASVLNFLVISLVIFAVIKLMHTVKKSEEQVAGPTATEKLLIEIRDALKK